MRRFFLVLALVVLAGGCDEGRNAQTVAEDQIEEPGLQVETEVPALPSGRNAIRVEFPTAGGTASGYLSVPATAGKHPGLIVIQEWWGVDNWIKENVDRFAGEGYVTLAVDLYRGRVTSDPTEAHELMRGLPQDRALADLRGGFAYLASRPDVDPARIGNIGWCMGGGYAINHASVEPSLRVAIVNYGHLITDPAAIRRINASMHGNFGGQDRGIPAEDVKKFELEAIRAGKTVDFKIFPNAGHGFMNQANKDGFNPEATEDAWRRIFTFLKQHLAGAAQPPA